MCVCNGFPGEVFSSVFDIILILVGFEDKNVFALEVALLLFCGVQISFHSCNNCYFSLTGLSLSSLYLRWVV